MRRQAVGDFGGDDEGRLVVRTVRREHAVDRQRQAERLGPLLQRRLRVLRRRGILVEHRGPPGADEAARRREAAVDEDRADQRFDAVGGRRLQLSPLGAAFAGRALHRRQELDAARDLQQGFLADKRRVPLGDGALVFLDEAFEQQFGHHEAQNPVAQEFQPLIAGAVANAFRGAGCAWMGQRAFQQSRVREAVADALLERAPRVSYFDHHAQGPMVVNMRSQRNPALKSVQSSPRQSIERNMMSARPTRFSAGT